jgi:hypothetical protein
MLFLPHRAIWTRQNQKPVVMFLVWSNTYVAAAETHWKGYYLHWFINRMQRTTIMNSTSTKCSSNNCCDELNVCTKVAQSVGHLIEELQSVGHWFAKTSGQVIDHSSLLKYLAFWNNSTFLPDLKPDLCYFSSYDLRSTYLTKLKQKNGSNFFSLISCSQKLLAGDIIGRMPTKSRETAGPHGLEFTYVEHLDCEH